MTPLPQLDTGALRLLRKVGTGRGGDVGSGSTLAIDYRRAGGAGVVVSGTLGTASVRIWVERGAWCRWVEPVLALDDVTSVPPDLRGALAAWTLASLWPGYGDEDGDSPGGWPTGVELTPETLPPTHGWCLSAACDGRRIGALVLDAPLAWLDSIATALPPLGACASSERPPGEPDSTPLVRASLVAGWTRLPSDVIRRLQTGDALVLQTSFEVAEHLFGLFLTRALARVRCDTTDHMEIDYIMDTFDDWLDVEPGIARDAADINAREPSVTVVAEVGTIDVPLSALAALSVGDVLTGQASVNALVALKIAGRVIARATLLDIDGKLAARIEQI